MKTAWRKSTRSGNDGGQCVQMRLGPAGPEVGDSKLGDRTPVLSVDRGSFLGLIAAIKSGRLDH
ncbi:DUF397 domain-containing protein [Phytomonospora sp. NPDC050363]|uniref:DUF397 domain-containing protein n=1 Tax=Phytomonospora sp. NPDC050363 TaxID=3155642 RepID=UPI00340E0E87